MVAVSYHKNGPEMVLTSPVQFCYAKIESMEYIDLRKQGEPELKNAIYAPYSFHVYALLEAFPGTKQNHRSHLSRLKNLVADASKGHYGGT